MLQVAELQDLVAWLTNKDHTLKARGEDPNTEHMQRLRAAAGVLDPKVGLINSEALLQMLCSSRCWLSSVAAAAAALHACCYVLGTPEAYHIC